MVDYGLSNRAIFNDPERSQTHISRSGHSLTLNISEMAKNSAIVTMEGDYYRKPKQSFQIVPLSMTLSDF